MERMEASGTEKSFAAETLFRTRRNRLVLEARKARQRGSKSTPSDLASLVPSAGSRKGAITSQYSTYVGAQAVTPYRPVAFPSLQH